MSKPIFRYIYWNRDTGNYVAVADPCIRINDTTHILFRRSVFVVFQGNTEKDNIDSVYTVKLTESGIEKLIINMTLGKRRYRSFRECQIRQWHPEFKIERLDECVEKYTLLERLTFT